MVHCCCIIEGASVGVSCFVAQYHICKISSSFYTFSIGGRGPYPLQGSPWSAKPYAYIVQGFPLESEVLCLCLRASSCKYRESGDSFEIFTFFIFCPNKAFSELFSKIQLKDPKALEFFQNRGKFENRHFGLPPPLKIDKNDAFSFRSCW